MADPTHVRLSNQHAHGILSDITDHGSLWTIAGLEVKPFPPKVDAEAQEFVREKLRKGVLEVAESVEYQEQEQVASALKAHHLASLAERLGSDTANVQEAGVQDIVREAQHRIMSRRAGVPVADAETPEEPSDPSEATQGSSRQTVPAGGGKGAAS